MNQINVMWIICGVLLAYSLWQTFRTYNLICTVERLNKELEKYTNPDENSQKIIDEYLDKAAAYADNESTVPYYVGYSVDTPATVAIEKLAGEVFVNGAAEWDKQVENAGAVAMAKVNLDKAIDTMHEKLEKGVPVTSTEVKKIDELITERNVAVECNESINCDMNKKNKVKPRVKHKLPSKAVKKPAEKNRNGASKLKNKTVKKVKNGK